MHHVIMQGNEGPHLPTLLEDLEQFGVTRVVFPGREYRSDGGGEAEGRRTGRNSMYETARLLPRGGDDGFAERFLKRRNVRDT